MVTGRNLSFPRVKKILEGKKINIIETGSVRGLEDHSRMGDGWSTYHWLEHSQKTGSNVWTVDIHSHAVNMTNKLKEKYFPDVNNFQAILGDSIEFLKGFTEKIDLLFLDSFDYCGDEENINKCHLHSLNEFKASEEKMTEGSYVLIDDVFNSDWDGKGKLCIPYILSRGYELVYFTDSQVLLKKQS